MFGLYEKALMVLGKNFVLVNLSSEEEVKKNQKNLLYFITF